MIAAQYEILLPADYDMEVIRRRVRERGTALDDRAGLGLKAYLVQDIAAGGQEDKGGVPGQAFWGEHGRVLGRVDGVASFRAQPTERVGPGRDRIVPVAGSARVNEQSRHQALP